MSRRDARRLMRLCASTEPALIWLAALREARDDLAIATHGEPLVIQVVMWQQCRVRLGITATGAVLHPCEGNEAADLRVEGEPEEVAAFLLGQFSLADAQERGLVTIRPGLVETRLDRLRGVVADKLRSVLDVHPVVVPASVAFSVRLRRLLEVPAELTAAALANVAPAVVATMALLGGPPPALAAHGAPVSAPAPVADTAPADVMPVAGQPARKDGAPAFAPAPTPRADPRRPPGSTATAQVAVTAKVQRSDRGLDGQERTINVPAWGRVHCTNQVRAALCDAVDRLPTPGS